MLFRKRDLERIRAGEIDLAFRRWTRPTVRTGGRLRTAVGELAIHEVRQVASSDITDQDARRAGYTDLPEFIRDLRQRRHGAIYRIAIEFAGEDHRTKLANCSDLTVPDLRAIAGDLERIDRRSPNGAWTYKALMLIGRHPGRRAEELATFSDMEKATFKRRVRRLKELGLIESLPVGYRLSPRGNRIADFLGGGKKDGGAASKQRSRASDT